MLSKNNPEYFKVPFNRLMIFSKKCPLYVSLKVQKYHKCKKNSKKRPKIVPLSKSKCLFWKKWKKKLKKIKKKWKKRSKRGQNEGFSKKGEMNDTLFAHCTNTHFWTFLLNSFKTKTYSYLLLFRCRNRLKIVKKHCFCKKCKNVHFMCFFYFFFVHKIDRFIKCCLSNSFFFSFFFE